MWQWYTCVCGGGGGEGVADPSAITYYCRSGNIHEVIISRQEQIREFKNLANFFIILALPNSRILSFVKSPKIRNPRKFKQKKITRFTVVKNLCLPVKIISVSFKYLEDDGPVLKQHCFTVSCLRDGLPGSVTYLLCSFIAIVYHYIKKRSIHLHTFYNKRPHIGSIS